MQFSTAQAPKTTWQRLSAQPHRLFFGSAVIWGVVMMALSMISFMGVAGIDFLSIHGYGMIYGLFINAFLGFLSTVIPRFSQSKEISKKAYLTYWLLYQLGLLASLLGFVVVGKLLSGLGLVYTAWVFFQTLRQGAFSSESDTLWLTGLLFACGGLLLASTFLGFDLLWMGIWVSILPITFTVAQRMIPFFYAGYFRNTYSKPAWVVPFFVLLSWIIAFSGPSSSFTAVATIVMAIGVIYFLTLVQIYQKSPPILWILRVGLLWLPVGLLVVGAEALWDGYSLKMGSHILLLGFVFTLLVGFGTRVLLGHSGQQIAADRITVYIFGAVQMTILLRIIASLFFIGDISAYTGILHLGFSLFVIVILVWGIRYRKAIF